MELRRSKRIRLREAVKEKMVVDLENVYIVQTCALLSLPQEIFNVIVSKCTPYEYANLSATCKQAKNMCNDKLLMEALMRNNFPSYLGTGDWKERLPKSLFRMVQMTVHVILHGAEMAVVAGTFFVELDRAAEQIAQRVFHPGWAQLWHTRVMALYDVAENVADADTVDSVILTRFLKPGGKYEILVMSSMNYAPVIMMRLKGIPKRWADIVMHKYNILTM
jgi:hypothetical protein